MYRKSRLMADGCYELPQKVLLDDGYDTRQIVSIIRRYHELRSAAEITIAVYEPIKSGGGLCSR